jgi:hypothetical protein
LPEVEDAATVTRNIPKLVAERLFMRIEAVETALVQREQFGTRLEFGLAG